MTLKQEIIEFVKLSTTEGVRDAGFSSPWISIMTGGLISIKSIGKSSTLANYLLVLLLQQGFDCKQVEDVGLLAVKLVLVLVVGTSSQLESLSTGMILGPGWMVLDGDLRDEWPLWWIHLEHCRVFGR